MNPLPTATNGRISLLPGNIFAAVATVAIFGVLFAWFPYASGYGAMRANMFEFMSFVWKDPEWEHCWLVPLAVIGLVYYRRKSLAALPVEGSLSGLFALCGAFFIYWVGYLADNIYIGYAALIGFVGAVVLWMLGWRWLKALAFPIAFLAFMFPLPFMDNLLAFPLRILMSAVSVGFLNLVGLSCMQSGTAIVSAPDFAAGLVAGQRFAVDVADPCSGIRSLFALMMVSAVYGYVAMDRPWQKWVVFLSSIPLAVAGNFARIIMLTLGTITLGPAKAIGSIEEPTVFHMASGFLVFAVALGGMLLVGAILQRLSKPKEPAAP
ncbi:MAG: exosortase/archaeosortase family protein [Chthoniobacterales bacterium]|nr:exosortase/archaeosortase family protein [Chthoniobacterales bacterium]